MADSRRLLNAASISSFVGAGSVRQHFHLRLQVGLGLRKRPSRNRRIACTSSTIVLSGWRMSFNTWHATPTANRSSGPRFLRLLVGWVPGR